MKNFIEYKQVQENEEMEYTLDECETNSSPSSYKWFYEPEEIAISKNLNYPLLRL